MSQGYDAAKRIQIEDDLGRWRLASEIADVIRSTPPEWSARIGIFGKWGEGKSTILHFLESMLKPEGNVVFYFNPWAAQDLDDLWAEFGKRLLDALSAANLLVEPKAKTQVRKVQQKLESSGLATLAEGTADLFGKAKFFSSAFGFMDNWLKPDGEQVRKIRDGLRDKRLIVFIDDLDRAVPELLPKLLLSLREILDLPGFTFVLAFDNEIVAGGLKTANNAWGDGDSFLDKILDFQYHLPPITKDGKHLLLRTVLDRYCKFIPTSSAESIEHLLPDNPRKLKALVRSLVSLKAQSLRHDPDELNWVDIWLAELIRQESYQFFERLLESDLDKLIGIGYRISRMSERKWGDHGEGSDENEIGEMMKGVGVVSEKQSKRLIELVDAARGLASMNVRYNWRFAFFPEAVTWKEFRALLVDWRANQKPQVLRDWVIRHSTTHSMKPSDVEEDLFQATLNAKHNELSAAAEALSVEENAVHCAEAALLLKMTQQLLSLPGLFTAERFENLYEKSSYWIAFRTNEADLMVREREREIVLKVLQKAPDEMGPALLEVLQPWDPWALAGENPFAATSKQQLRGECVALLSPKAERAFVDSLRQPESIRRLANSKQYAAYRWLLFAEEHLPWNGTIRDALFALARKGSSERIEYEKIIDFLNLLANAGQDHFPLTGESATKIVSDRDFTREVWRSVISERIQFRMQNKVLGYRHLLIKLGADESDLPLSPELEDRSRAEQG